MKNLELDEAERTNKAGQRTLRLTLDRLASSFAELEQQLALAAADAAAVLPVCPLTPSPRSGSRPPSRS